ncbi:hypothetical protein F4809DRAFT_21574 [Biscogniauxia mediterranea]|nr:hypothetical protein F4809DRAFT_21574 [Biscogniauxia mediterranea]
MRFTIFSILAVGATLAIASPKIEARQELGTFDTFTDDQCDEGGKGITVPEDGGFIDFEPGVEAVKSYLPDNCALVIWYKSTGTTQPPFIVISPNRKDQCVTLQGVPSETLFWSGSCN